MKLALFPVFVDLKGKKCVVAGGGSVAARKIRSLLPFGTYVTVISPEVCAELERLAENDEISWVRREYRAGDLDGAFMAIAATSNSEVNESVAVHAKKEGILINAAHTSECEGFMFPSLVVRGDLCIGINTSGDYPALSRLVRKSIEEMLSGEFNEIVVCLKEFRSYIKDNVENIKERRKLLSGLLDGISHDDLKLEDIQKRIYVIKSKMHSGDDVFEDGRT